MMKCSIEIFYNQMDSKNICKIFRFTDRITLILDELNKFIKLKEYISSKKPEFSLYLINQKLIKKIEFCSSNDFSIRINEISDLLQGQTFKNDPIELNEIFIEA